MFCFTQANLLASLFLTGYSPNKIFFFPPYKNIVPVKVFKDPPNIKRGSFNQYLQKTYPMEKIQISFHLSKNVYLYFTIRAVEFLKQIAYEITVINAIYMRGNCEW